MVDLLNASDCGRIRVIEKGQQGKEAYCSKRGIPKLGRVFEPTLPNMNRNGVAGPSKMLKLDRFETWNHGPCIIHEVGPNLIVRTQSEQ